MTRPLTLVVKNCAPDLHFHVSFLISIFFHYLLDLQFPYSTERSAICNVAFCKKDNTKMLLLLLVGLNYIQDVPEKSDCFEEYCCTLLPQ